MTLSPESIVRIASYFTIISHTEGRLRVRVNPDIRREAGHLSLEAVESLPEKIKGIKTIKINKLIASITIVYDPEVFEKRLWDDLINGENLDEIVPIIRKLQKEIV